MTSQDKIETINDLDNNLNKSVYKEETLKEPNYSYWESEEPLDGQVAVINQSFNRLVDTPNSYVWQNWKIVSVKTDETWLEFVDKPTVNTYVWTDTISLTAWASY